MKYLLDTRVISELIAKRPNRTVLDWLDAQVPSDLYLSVITIGELTKGVRRLPDSRRKSDLEHWLENDLLVRFAGRTPTIELETR